jgi:hypothetical protein
MVAPPLRDIVAVSLVDGGPETHPSTETRPVRSGHVVVVWASQVMWDRLGGSLFRGLDVITATSSSQSATVSLPH